MENKKNPNPKSDKLHTRDYSSNSRWSELPLDIFNSVFERLGLADFKRALSVCSSWYSASKQCVSKHQNPWLILFSNYKYKYNYDLKNDSSCTLFNPEEKEGGGKLYNIHVEDIRETSVCLATYGSWLFMLEEGDWRYDLYIVNLFTKERFDLPCVELQIGTTKVEQTQDGWFQIASTLICKGIDMQSPVFWIDEKTKDYVVIWGFGHWCVVYSKKGDKVWTQIPLLSSTPCSHMVYKDHKLYLIKLDYYGKSFIKIFDFSQEVPRETFHCDGAIAHASNVCRHRNSWKVWLIKLVVTVTGELLKVEKMVRSTGQTQLWSFRVYKVFNNFEQVDSLGDEAMLFDIGVTVLANGVEGFKRNSIYSSIVSREKKTTQIRLFDMETQKMETLHNFDCSSAQQLAKARWFLPSFRS